MRVKKQARHRKIITFYSACYGFHEPFKVLCDGSFIQHLVNNDSRSPADALSDLLAARVLPFSTRCINAELKSKPIIQNYGTEALKVALTLPLARCQHETAVKAPECIMSIVEGGNLERFFVATQDHQTLGNKLHQMPGVPLIYGLRKALHIRKPSECQREFAKHAEEKRKHMTESECRELHKSDEFLASQFPKELGSRGKLEMAKSSGRSSTSMHNLGVADKTKFKRKKAKGPNPLSCKKKKRKEEPLAPENQDIKGGDKIKRMRTGREGSREKC